MIIQQASSPNFNQRPEGVLPDTIVLHYTGMKTANDSLARLCDAEAKVSSHYLIDENGEIFALVDEAHRAWHAGVSYWAGRNNVNDFSIGIELQNLGHQYGYTAFPDAQMNALIMLLQDISTRRNIRPEGVVAHSDIAPDRKEDPGELFNWKLLADNGVSIWPAKDYSVKSGGRVIARAGDTTEYVGTMQKKLQDFGYKIAVTGEFDIATVRVVTAFRRRFTPNYLHPLIDEMFEIYLSDLLGNL